MNQTVYALFPNHDEAHYALQDLLSKGFSKDSISLAVYQPGVKTEDKGTLMEGGAVAGLGAGLVTGGLLGTVLGILSVFILPTGLIIAGPVAWVIAGAASGGATGTFLGALIGLGIPKDQADFYAEGVHRGGTLLLVAVDDSNLEQAEAILDRDGAIDVKSMDHDFRTTGVHEFEDAGRTYTEEVPTRNVTVP